MKKTHYQTEKIRFLPPADILPGPVLSRGLGRDLWGEALLYSIARYGILQPLLIQRSEKGFVLLSGSRRLAAAKLLGLESVPCRLLDLPPRDAAEILLAENLHRRALDAVEEAVAAKRLMKAHPYRMGELARRIGEKPSELSAKLRLLHFSPEERRLFLEFGLSPLYGESILHLRSGELRCFAIRQIGEEKLTLEEANDLCMSLALHPEEFAPPVKVRKGEGRLPVGRFSIKDVGFFVNSLERLISSIIEAGISAECDRSEKDGYYTYKIRIPKGKKGRENR